MNEKVLEIRKRIEDKKASGLIGIPNKALELVARIEPKWFISRFELSLIEGVFPVQRKKRKFILLLKPQNQWRILFTSFYLSFSDCGTMLERVKYNRVLPFVERSRWQIWLENICTGKCYMVMMLDGRFNCYRTQLMECLMCVC